jgi:ATP-dependent Clp protease protease subunit
MSKKQPSRQIINPFIYEKTRDGEILYDVFSRLIKDRIVFLADCIDVEAATIIAATLLFLDNQSHDKPISVYINSPGGTVHDGLFTIYDTMNYIEAPIKTTCIGEACSAAATILSAGTPGMRAAFQNSSIMIHEIQISELSGPGTDIIREAERIGRWNEKLFEIMARNTGHTIDEIKKICERDKYFTAEEAKDFGLIDKIIEPKKEIPELKAPSLKKKK